MSHLHSFVESVVAVVSILPACASFLMALVTFGGAGASYLPYAPAGAGTSPSGGGAGCRLCALIKLLEGMTLALWDLLALRTSEICFKDSSSLAISHIDRHIIRSRMVTLSTNLPRT